MSLPTLSQVLMERDDEMNEVAKLLPYIFDHLGEATMRIWFSTYLHGAT